MQDSTKDEEFIPVNEIDIGLDRSTINKHGQIQLPQQHPAAAEENVGRRSRSNTNTESPQSSHGSSHHLFSSINERRHDAAAKIKRKLHVSKPPDDISSDAPILANPSEDSGARLVHELPEKVKPTLKDLAHNPVDTIKEKVGGQGSEQIAANIAAKEIPHGQEVDLVNAQNALNRARTEREKLLAIQDVSKLMRERQNTFVRWTLDRHVTKLRILPRDTVQKKPIRAYETKNAQGDVVVDWRAYAQNLLIFYAHQDGGQYVGFGSNPPPPSKETIMPNIERLIVASSPLQEFIMTTRRVYRWERPAGTTKYLLVYLTLWYFNLLLPGVLSVLVYLVIERRLHGNSLEDLREDIKHREDTDRVALSLTEYIEKKGDEKWADELLEGVGPWLMIQLADMANMFESMRNFYEWRVPNRTFWTLAVFVVGILITAVVPVWLLVKTMTFSAGLTFFALFPIGTNFPEYRLLVSPTKRLLWNIPTHAEWAVKTVQAEGTRYEEEHKSPPPPTFGAASGEQDYGFYVAHHEDHSGYLIISASSIRFVTKHDNNIHWTLPYSQINNLEKVNRIMSQKIPKPKTDSGKDLKLVTKTGEEHLVRNIDKRDEVFSQIVGFSATTWQVSW